MGSGPSLEDTLGATEGGAGEDGESTLPGSGSVDETIGAVEESGGYAPGPTAIEDGSMLDHFVIVRRLGAGAMGLVFEAYDPDLDRRVAIKVLRAPGPTHASARQRMLREAQSMAKVVHPNVVTVYQVGTAREQIYIAMELVDGCNLREWSTASSRSISEVIGVFVDAARGLVAAHAAGLVHRDFKPDNVLVARDGRVAVTDFGVVAMRESAAQAVARLEQTGPVRPESSGTGAIDLTETGRMMGTPAYMAPEQHACAPVDARADQFAFCVALWEALYGERPFRGDTLPTLVTHVLQDERTMPPARNQRGQSIPRRVRRALVRGLAVAADDRWPSMEVLLGELAPARSHRGAWLAAAVSVAASGGVLASWPSQERAAAERCERRSDAAPSIWDGRRKASLEQSFEATGMAYARDAAARVGPALDAWVADWQRAQTEACDETYRGGTQSETLLELRNGCFDRQLAEVEALVAAFTGDVDTQTVIGAAKMVDGLPRPDACADADALLDRSRRLRDPGNAEAVRSLERDLEPVYVAIELGRYAHGHEALSPVLQRARELDEPVVLARALLFDGRILGKLGQAEAAEEALREAIRLAAESDSPDVELEAWLWLIQHVGQTLAEHQRAEGLLAAAEASTRRVDDSRLEARFHQSAAMLRYVQGRLPEAEDEIRRALELAGGAGADDSLVAYLLNILAAIISDRGNLDEAEAHYRRAIEIWEDHFGENHPAIAAAATNLGQQLQNGGDLDGANELYARTLQIWSDAYGPADPNVALARENLGVILYLRGDSHGAREHFEASLGIRRAFYGDEHPQVGHSHSNLAMVHLELGEHEQARAGWEEASRIWKAVLGEEHPQLVDVELNLGNASLQVGDFARALEHFERSRHLAEKTLGPRHPHVARALGSMANVHRQQGRCAEAIPIYRRARAMLEEGGGLDNVEGAHVLGGLGWCSLEEGRFSQASELFTHAIEIRAPGRLEPILLARERHGLALALWGLNRREEAVAAAESALQTLEGIDPSRAPIRDDIVAWLSTRAPEHGAAPP